MLLRIDPSSPVPLFEQLAAAVRADIGRGDLSAGDRLPSARELAESLDINLHTVLRAYQQLREEGLVDLRRGRGATVTSRAGEYAGISLAIPQLVLEAKRLGLSASALTALIREEYNT